MSVITAMVHKVRKNEVVYACEVCGLNYREKFWAERCQDYCAKHDACSLEIISYAVQTG